MLNHYLRTAMHTNGTIFNLSELMTMTKGGPCLAAPRVTWPTTVSVRSSPMSDNCVLQTLENSLSVGCAAVFVPGPLPPQDYKSGTACRPISDYVGCHTASSGGY